MLRSCIMIASMHSIHLKKTLRKSVEFPHESEEINKTILTNKLKAIRIKFRAAVDSGRKSGHGRIVSSTVRGPFYAHN